MGKPFQLNIYERIQIYSPFSRSHRFLLRLISFSIDQALGPHFHSQNCSSHADGQGPGFTAVLKNRTKYTLVDNLSFSCHMVCQDGERC